MKSTIAILALLMLSACTTSFTIVHTQGTATDVVDEAQTPNVNASIPIKAI